MRLRSGPLQQQKFRAKTRTKCGGQCVVARLKWPLFQPLLQDEEDCGAGEIADIAENIPRRLRLALRQSQRNFDITKETRAARMQDPALDVFLLQAVALEEAVNKALDFCANHFRKVFGQQDVKSGIAQVEAHGAE